MNLRIQVALFSIVSGWLLAQQSSAQHFDVFLARPAVGDKTAIGGADVDALIYDDVLRVFESEMGLVADEFLALEPGVNHPDVNNPGLAAYPASAAALETGDTLRLIERDFAVGAATDDLFYWNGVGAVLFAPAAADFRIDGGDPLGSLAGAGGVFDDHPFLVVDSDALPGIYLASLYGVVDGFAPSEPVYLVIGTEGLITAEFLGISAAEFEQLSEEELEEALDGVIDPAVDYVQSHLVVPEPACWALVSFGGLFVTLWRRRK